jgi:hypothetical protein
MCKGAPYNCLIFLQVARTRTSDRRVWQRACDYLGLMQEPAICLSVLGPSTAQGNGPGIVNWSEGETKMVAHVPFYLLAEQKGKSSVNTSIITRYYASKNKVALYYIEMFFLHFNH